MTTAAIRSTARQSWAIVIYRSLLNLALLVAGFSAFPEHKTFIALAVLAFSHGIAAIGAGQASIAASQNHLDDMAERKTRQAILLAHEDWSSNFWLECDRRVAAELVGQAPASRWWTQLGLVVVNLGGRLCGDLITILLAIAVSNLSY